MELNMYFRKLDMEVNRYQIDCDTASKILRNGDYRSARGMLTELRDRHAKFNSHFSYPSRSISDKPEADNYLSDCNRTILSAKQNLESLFSSYGYDT